MYKSINDNMADAGMMERDDLITYYFYQDYTYKEILAFLLKCHGVDLSIRQLKRHLKRLNLSKRTNKDSLETLKKALQVELEGNGCNLGYRAMYQKLSTIYMIKTSRDDVYKLMKDLDPEGLIRRAGKRLKRRQYVCKGPNYSWHLDGYDKLKPYGFCIHGCIDGYSRKILWLEVASTNNDPSIVASYFINYVSEIKGTARRIRGDFGTENVNVAAMQRFFRDNANDTFAGEKSFIFGRSTSNQRIESLWSKLRQSTTQFWMDFFADMRDDGSLREDDEAYRECLRFCFMTLLQTHLKETRMLYNTHRIRYNVHQFCPAGKPNLIYDIPQAYESKDYKTEVSQEDILISYENACNPKLPYGCSNEYCELFQELMNLNDWKMPIEENEAKELYINLSSKLLGLI